jgi:hypothetical protein
LISPPFCQNQKDLNKIIKKILYSDRRATETMARKTNKQTSEQGKKQGNQQTKS